jgi:uncharacterized protein (TIRG00374 family)
VSAAGHGILTSRRLHLMAWTTLLSALAYLGVSLWSGWADVMSALRRVGPASIAILLAMSLVNYALRFVRWQYYLGRLGHRVAAVDSLRIYLAGFGLTIVPGKVGEAVRSLFLKAHGVGYHRSLAAFFAERFSDLVSMVCLTAVGFSSYRAGQLGLLLLAVALLAALAVLYRQRWIDALRRFAVSRLPARLAGAVDSLTPMIDHARTCLMPKAMAIGLGLGLSAWAAEGFAFHFLLDWMGEPIAWQSALFIYAFSMLVGAATFLPGGLGGADATMIGLLSVHNVPLPVAVATTIVIRVATLWFAVMLGIAALSLQLRDGARPASSRS